MRCDSAPPASVTSICATASSSAWWPYTTPAGFKASAAAGPTARARSARPAACCARSAVVHVDDLRADPSYRERDPGLVAFAELAGTRTVLGVPMLKDGDRSATDDLPPGGRPFTDKQIELVTLRRPGRNRYREHAVVQRNPQSRCSSRPRRRRYWASFRVRPAS